MGWLVSKLGKRGNQVSLQANEEGSRVSDLIKLGILAIRHTADASSWVKTPWLSFEDLAFYKSQGKCFCRYLPSPADMSRPAHNCV